MDFPPRKAQQSEAASPAAPATKPGRFPNHTQRWTLPDGFPSPAPADTPYSRKAGFRASTGQYTNSPTYLNSQIEISKPHNGAESPQQSGGKVQRLSRSKPRSDQPTKINRSHIEISQPGRRGNRDGETSDRSASTCLNSIADNHQYTPRLLNSNLIRTHVQLDPPVQLRTRTLPNMRLVQ